MEEQIIIRVNHPPKKEITVEQLKAVGGIENINKLTGSFNLRHNADLLLRYIHATENPRTPMSEHNNQGMLTLSLGFALGYLCAMEDKPK